ncbi:MAG: DASS family sodium-coupled anion symporter [Opitutaceae bacterium]|nr:DASS family sodium-coupled anion symporter [Opitutaceae bacterium]
MLAMVVVWLLGRGSVPREAAWMSGIFVLAAGLWVTEALPLFATSLLVIGLQLILLANPGGWPGLGFETGVSPSYREILSVVADPVLLLFFGGFVLARAAVKEGVDRAMSAVLLRPFGTEPRRVLLGLMLITLLFSMWMSNTATTVMMLALVTPMLAAMPPGEPFRKALVLGVPFAANIGGMGTPIASPPNAVAMGFLQKAGHHVGFLDWMLVAVPLVIGLALFTWWVLTKFFAPSTAGLRLGHARAQLTRRGWLVVAVFAVTVILWLTDRWHGLPSAVVALLPAVVFTATGIFTREDLGRLEWHILILIAGGISLGTGLQLTGLDRIAVSWLPASGGSGLWLLAGLVLATMVVGSFMSNTAAANLLLPIGLSAAVTAGPAGGLSPVQAAVSIALAASLSMVLPVSTPPNAIAYARGEFTTRDMARVALLVGGLAAVLIVAGGGIVMRFWGLVE